MCKLEEVSEYLFMVFFSVVEIFNKFTGLLIVSLYARIMPIDIFALHMSVVIFFGYFFELSSFSYQKTHLVSLDRHGEKYLYSSVFSNRLFITALFSLLSCLSFYIFFPAKGDFSPFFLCFVLLLPIINFDFVLYYVQQVNKLVMIRFLAQALALLTVLAIYFYDILSVNNIFLINLIQSSILAILISYFTFKDRPSLMRSIVKNIKIRSKGLISEAKSQSIIFLTNLLVLISVTLEIPVLLYFGDDGYKNMAIGNRVAIILLPFLLFYLNKNVASINSSHIVRYMCFSAIGAAVLMLGSPLIILAIFGESYLSGMGPNNYFFIIVLFQLYVNYSLFVAIKSNASIRYFYALFIPSILSIVILYVLLGDITLFYIVTIYMCKVFLVFMMSPIYSFKQKVLCSLVVFVPVIFNYYLIEIGYYDIVNEFVGEWTRYIIQRDLYES